MASTHNIKFIILTAFDSIFIRNWFMSYLRTLSTLKPELTVTITVKSYYENACLLPISVLIFAILNNHRENKFEIIIKMFMNFF